ncbi:zinc finger protein SHOOT GRAVITROPISM 5-like [Rhododendron vialii]|uniref:zinc finger protein SHOOT GRAVITROPISM 5-like n=1 Tax=Rhododendron vialii TaxID=182163 RepID=UPI00265F6F12|nr:zinc finger protein SHOOT GRAVITROPISM 5-like [Rhododendron vialii]
MENDQKELQLLPTSSSSLKSRSTGAHRSRSFDRPPPVDLQLSMSSRPIRPPSDRGQSRYQAAECDSGVEATRWQAAEQIRMAGVEKAYAERVREMTRREMELAQSEFARARHVWESAREEVERAERMKERAIQRVDGSSTCMEITCHSCSQKFRPN